MSEHLRNKKSLDEHIKEGAKRRIPSPQRAPKAPRLNKPFLRPSFEVRKESVTVVGCPIHGQGTHQLHECEVIREQAVLVQFRRRDGDMKFSWFPSSVKTE